MASETHCQASYEDLEYLDESQKRAIEHEFGSAGGAPAG